ncbi:diacylglycerol/lipid kinase family protein [Fodinibius salinus]|uniref:diacylglycerol/lipid kinase family protein n=1 Tax=Fodinibius salinus TaxID=860790 RepID=UPI0011E813A5|nr:acylglycerol kinase family protein [Fodinibius salinus]
MKHFAFIYNPAAGYGKSHAKFSVLKQKIAEKSGCEFFTSESEEHISDLIQRLSTNFDVFVACGGDGTVREVAKAVIEIEAAMGIIPMGNGNDLCKTLKIPTAIEDAFELIFCGDLQEIDVGW